MTSLRARLVRSLSRQFFKRITPDDDVGEVRANWEAMARRMKTAPQVGVRRAVIAGIECEWLVPEGCDDAPVLFYLHGGAYLCGSARTHRRMVSFIARDSGMRAVLPEYRLAPEHRFPAALDDALAVYRSLVGESDGRMIAIGGDSAGGGLAMATLLALRDAGCALPAAAALLSPWLDLAGTGESMQTNAHNDPWFDAEDMPAIVEKYCSPYDVRNPLVSPVYGDPSGLPPVLIQVGDLEILLSDATRMADRISDAGGRVVLQVWPGMWHVWQYFVGQMPESRRAIEQIGQFLAGNAGA